jgi:hypothetical protein
MPEVVGVIGAMGGAAAMMGLDPFPLMLVVALFTGSKLLGPPDLQVRSLKEGID